MSIFSAALKRRCAAGFVLGTLATLRRFACFFLSCFWGSLGCPWGSPGAPLGVSGANLGRLWGVVWEPFGVRGGPQVPPGAWAGGFSMYTVQAQLLSIELQAHF